MSYVHNYRANLIAHYKVSPDRHTFTDKSFFPRIGKLCKQDARELRIANIRRKICEFPEFPTTRGRLRHIFGTLKRRKFSSNFTFYYSRSSFYSRPEFEIAELSVFAAINLIVSQFACSFNKLTSSLI